VLDVAERRGRRREERVVSERPEFVHVIDPSATEAALRRITTDFTVLAPQDRRVGIVSELKELLESHNIYSALFTPSFLMLSPYSPSQFVKELRSRLWMILKIAQNRANEQLRICYEMLEGREVSEQTIASCLNGLRKSRVEIVAALKASFELISLVQVNLPAVYQSNLWKAQLGYQT
jgi:hypothetical protein